MGLDLGTWGVSIFFTISGFLLVKRFDYSLRYFWKRGLRIIPGLFVVTFLTVFILGPLVTTLNLSEYFHRTETWGYLIHIAIFQNTLPGVFIGNCFPNEINSPLWVLPHFFIIYIILFLYGRWGLLNKRYIILVLYIAAFGILIVQPIILSAIRTCISTTDALNTITIDYHIFPTFHEIIYTSIRIILSWSFWSHYLYFFGGALLALYDDVIKFDCSILAIMCILEVLAYAFDPQLSKYSLHIFVPYFAIAFALIQNDILKNLRIYGDFSYGMYIYAFPIQQTIAYFMGNGLTPLQMFIQSLLTAFVFAIISWNLVESPMLKLKNKTLPFSVKGLSWINRQHDR